MKGEAVPPQLVPGGSYQAAVAGGVAGPVDPLDAESSAPSYMPPKSEEPARRTLLKQAFVDTVAQPGARAGAAWIAVVVFFAVFAPFLASSFPIFMRTRDGGWHWPMFTHLYAIDVVLVVTFLAVCALALWRGLSFSASLLALIGVIV